MLGLKVANMLKITITEVVDLKKLESEMMQAFRRGLRDIVNAAHGEWQDEAGRNLHKTRDEYQAALKKRKVDPDTYEITLHHPEEKMNWLVTALEVGYGSFDIKPALLKSDAATQWSQFAGKKAGSKKIGAPFVDVPFRTGSARRQNKPNKWRRLTEKSSGWKHPGFKARSYREHVKEYIKEEAKNVFGPLLAKITV